MGLTKMSHVAMLDLLLNHVSKNDFTMKPVLCLDTGGVAQTDTVSLHEARLGLVVVGSNNDNSIYNEDH
jgi:hypothetical protein